MSVEIKVPRKLIEVALPLDAINAAAAREKSIRHGHPSTLHLWWARRPLAAARAVIFSQIVNDPEDLWRCQNPGVEPKPQHKSHWTKRRGELFRVIEELVKWENTTNQKVLNEAREEIRKAWRETCELNKNHPQAKELFDPAKMPGLHDPFAGGGAIPLEAQRLGLEAYASDLNPVAVLINKAMIEIPPKFSGKPPVHSQTDAGKQRELIASTPEEWSGSKGLAEDVRYYGKWMRDEAFRRIGDLYPPIEITKEMAKDRPDLKPYVGEKLTVIAWLWTRTVKSPNPAFSSIDVPLTSTFILSSREGKEAYVEPVVSKSGYAFTVRVGKLPASAKAGTKAARGANFTCLMSNTPIQGDHIKSEAVAGRMSQKLMAIVAEGTKGRVYLSPTDEHEAIARKADPKDAASMIHVELADDPRNLWCVQYGLTHFDHLFTQRQLVALTTFSDLVSEVRERIRKDAILAGLTDDNAGLDGGGTGALAYAEAVSVYLAFAVSKITNIGSGLASWMSDRGAFRETFARQALPMVWDYAEANSFADAGGSFDTAIDKGAMTVEALPSFSLGRSSQFDAANQTFSAHRFVSTDPPYYDNIAYADLSDFFYVWLRRSLRSIYPNLLSTIAVPKAEELVATPYRHGNKDNAEKFFLEGMTKAMNNLAKQAHPAAPITIYYAFKQSETDEANATSSSGWVTFLEAVLRAGFALTGTWPMRTEGAGRIVAKGTNALASSIILVCRPREKNAGTIDRRRFQRLLNETLPLALDAMTRESEGLHSPVAPVDLSQAIIGPGMGIFSRYDAVLEANGTPMTVKTALQLINRFLAEEDFDPDTQFCLHWFETHKWDAGKFGDADVLARAKGTGVDGLKAGGVLESSGGNVRLYKWEELPADWEPENDSRLSIWEILHHLIRKTNSEGERGGGALLSKTHKYSESVRTLAYRLYTICERRGWAADASAYNNLVLAWESLDRAAQEVGYSGVQISLFGDDEPAAESKTVRKTK